MKQAEMVRVGHYANHNTFCAEYRTILQDELKQLPYQIVTSQDPDFLKEVKQTKDDILDVLAFKLNGMTDKVERIEQLVKTSNSLVELSMVDAKVTWQDHKDEYGKIHKSTSQIWTELCSMIDLQISHTRLCSEIKKEADVLKLWGKVFCMLYLLNVILTIASLFK